VDWLRAERPGVQIPAVATDFSLFQNAESGTEDHPDSCSVSIGVSFLGVKRPGREAVWKTLPGQCFPPGTSTFVFQLSFHQLPVSVYLPRRAPLMSPLSCSCWNVVSQHHSNQTERFLFLGSFHTNCLSSSHLSPVSCPFPLQSRNNTACSDIRDKGITN
jgi:hypothetical protein